MIYFLLMRIFSFTLIMVFSVTTLLADTVVLKDRTEVKGLVVDEYVDRVTLSTVDGEKGIFREDIERIEYDAPEQNFMQLGRSYEARGFYDKAAFYYKKAMSIKPDYKEAREAYIASHAKIWRQEERMTRKELERRSMVMNWWKTRRTKAVSKARDKELLLKDTLGISLVEREEVFTIDYVEDGSSAGRAGIKPGDMLVSIWGRLIKYSKRQEIVDELLGPKHSEVRIGIERDILLKMDRKEDIYSSLGMLLGFEYEGLVVKELIPGALARTAGFRKGDFIIAIDGHVTRYMPLDSVIALINSSDNEDIVFTIKRSATLRRKDE